MIGKKAELVLNKAVRYAVDHEHEYFTLEHVFWSLLSESSIVEAIVGCGGNPQGLRRELESYMDQEIPKIQISTPIVPEVSAGNSETDGVDSGCEVNDGSTCGDGADDGESERHSGSRHRDDEVPLEHPVATLSIQRLIQRALFQVQSAGKDEIQPMDLLVAIFQAKDSHSLYLLNQQNIERLDVLSFISHGVRRSNISESENSEDGDSSHGQDKDDTQKHGKKFDQKLDKNGAFDKSSCHNRSSKMSENSVNSSHPYANSKKTTNTTNTSNATNSADSNDTQARRKSESFSAEVKKELRAGASSSSTSGVDETLKVFCVCLTEKAKQGKLDPLVGRDFELDRMIQTLCRRRKNNPILIGEAGVGKTALAEGLATRISQNRVPEPLLNAVVYLLDMGALVAGAKFRGDFEQRLKRVLWALSRKKEMGQPPILVIDEIHTMVGAGAVSGGALDAANLLKPLLSEGEIRCIGSTTYQEFRGVFEKDRALARRFQKIEVSEPTQEESIQILSGIKDKYEKHHHVVYLPQALRSAVELSVKHLADRFLPDKAIDVIDEAGSRARTRMSNPGHNVFPQLEIATRSGVSTQVLAQDEKQLELQVPMPSPGPSPSPSPVQGQTRIKPQEHFIGNMKDVVGGQQLESELGKDCQSQDSPSPGKDPKLEQTLAAPKKIDSDLIEEVIAQMARIPARSVSVDHKQKLKNLERDLKLTLFGQDHAIEALATAIRLARSGLRNGDKPVGSFLFCGPTGVGKTELSKQLANLLGVPFLRYDMSEYAEKHTVSRLIGAPPGYVGFEQAGVLTEAAVKNPHSVILLDEIEKAHADIWNVLLQVMDYGILTDNNGRKADFRNMIIIMTSNVGSRELGRKPIGMGAPDLKTSISQKEVERIFSPEFRNRLDCIVYFNTLSPVTVGYVVGKQLLELESQLLAKNIEIEVGPEVREWLAQRGYEPAMGARPLARLIEDKIKKPLSLEILFGKLENGGTVKVHLKNDDLWFEMIPVDRSAEDRDSGVLGKLQKKSVEKTRELGSYFDSRVPEIEMVITGDSPFDNKPEHTQSLF